MATAAERKQARSIFLGLAGQAERLRNTRPDHTTYDPDALRRFQNVYGEELHQIVRWRDEMIEKPALDSAAIFEARIEYAREVLKQWTDPLPP